MSPNTWTLDRRLLESLGARVRQRLQTGLTLARADRFLQELEPGSARERDPFGDLASAFKAWRRAMRAGDADGWLDALELTGLRLEVCRRRVDKRDRAVEAFRVRWACENAALRHPTIDSLARLYRLLPFSTSSQSKYEYVLTRRLAGPVSPDRRLPGTQELLDAVTALGASWGAAPVQVDDSEAATIVLVIESFGYQASQHKDAAEFTASALLRRFGAFKASIGEKLFDPRLSVAVVETNVKVLNVLNHLLAEAGAKPLRIAAATDRAVLPVAVRKRATPPAPADSGLEAGSRGSGQAEEPAPFIQVPRTAAAAGKQGLPPKLRTSDADISALDVVRRLPAVSPEASTEEGLAAPAVAVPAESSPAAASSDGPSGAEASPVRARADLRTGEVDLSGLEVIKRLRRAGADASPGSKAPPEPETEPEAPQGDLGTAAEGPGEGSAGADGDEARPARWTTEADEPEREEAEEEAAEQLPSSRAYELAALEENAWVIEHYLTRPRSPEVWRLNLDSFLSAPNGEDADPQNQGADRRRAFELILASDDLICFRKAQEGPPTPEHRGRVKERAQQMLRLQTSLRRASGFAGRDQGETEALLYVSDHLLWERLRLTASLTRNPVRKRVPLLPRATRAAEAARRHTSVLRLHRRILLSVVAVAAILTAVIGVLGVSAPRSPVDPRVNLIPVQDLPEPQIFQDARAFRNRLFVTADLSWIRLGMAERLAIVSSVADFAAERGFDSVSLIGPAGEALATFSNNEVFLAEDLETVAEEP